MSVKRLLLPIGIALAIAGWFTNGVLFDQVVLNPVWENTASAYPGISSYALAGGIDYSCFHCHSRDQLYPTPQSRPRDRVRIPGMEPGMYDPGNMYDLPGVVIPPSMIDDWLNGN